MVVMKGTLELRDEQVNGVVMQHISDKVEVQHYVHLRLELRRFVYMSCIGLCIYQTCPCKH